MIPYARIVPIRKIFAIFVALSVLFAPAVAGAAMVTPHHDMQMMEAGHCQAPPSSSGDHQKMGGKSCCIAMCMAVAVTASAQSEVDMPRRQVAQFAFLVTYTGTPEEIATPPPRHN